MTMVLPSNIRESNVNPDVDVLCGRGGNGINRNPANMQFRVWVELFRDDYVHSVKSDKVKISARIVAMVYHNGGRFVTLDHDKKEWLPISDRKALEKTSQALREMPRGPQSTDKFRASNQSTRQFQKRFLALYNRKSVLKRAQELLCTRTSTAHLDIEPTEPFRYIPTVSSSNTDTSTRSKSNKKSSSKKQKRDDDYMVSKRGLGNKCRRALRNAGDTDDDDDQKEYDDKVIPSHYPSGRSRRITQRPKTYQEGQPVRMLPKTTLDNRPIRVDTLELDDFPSSSSSSSSSSSNDGNDDMVPPAPSKIRRTRIGLDPVLLTQPLYDRWKPQQHDDDDDNDNYDHKNTSSVPSVPLYSAAHDIDELVAMGMSTSSTAGPSRKHQGSNHDADDKEENLPLTRVVSKHNKKLFGPGQQIIFGG